MHRLGIQYSYTLEASFGGSTIGNRAGTHLGICDLENMGKEGDFIVHFLIGSLIHTALVLCARSLISRDSPSLDLIGGQTTVERQLVGITSRALLCYYHYG